MIWVLDEIYCTLSSSYTSYAIVVASVDVY